MKKILLIGGACQGKTAYAKEHYREYTAISAAEFPRVEPNGLQAELPAGFLLNGFHLWMKMLLAQGADYKEAVRVLIKVPGWIIISDEIGMGIVPMEKSERVWREETGRMLCQVAAEADEVYRICCGIPFKIK